MFPKNLSSGFLTTTSKINIKNLIPLNSLNTPNNLTLTIKPPPSKIKTLKASQNISYTKVNDKFKIQKHKNIKSARIYLKLEEKDEIEKIINEEEKKRYFNQDFRLNKNVNREELKRRIGKKIPFNGISNKKFKNDRHSILKIQNQRPKTTMKTLKKFGGNKSRNIISINKILLQNFRSQGESEIQRSKKNLELVNDFLKKMDEEKMHKFNEIEKQFQKNKTYDGDNLQIKEDLIKSKNIKNIKLESLKLKESDFLKFRKKQMIKEKQDLQLKSRIFDNILKNDFGGYYPPKYEDSKHKAVNYRLLSRTILMRNLMKQMKVAVYKDETLNVLRGFQSLKISNLSKDKLKLDNQDIYSNHNDNLFVFGNNMRHKPVPHFLKVKFSKKTSKKFGEINGSYFGLPV